MTARLIRKRAAPLVRLGLRCHRGVAKADDIGKPGTPNGPPSTAPITVTLKSVFHTHDTAMAVMTGKYRDVYAFLRAGSDYSSTEWIAYEATDAQDLEGVDIDGIIGCDFLQFFNVYFDYGHHAIYLEPNDAYRRAAHH